MPVNDKAPPIFIGSDVGVDGFVTWPETGNVANTIANETRKMVILLFFIS